MLHDQGHKDGPQRMATNNNLLDEGRAGYSVFSRYQHIHHSARPATMLGGVWEEDAILLLHGDTAVPQIIITVGHALPIQRRVYYFVHSHSRLTNNHEISFLFHRVGFQTHAGC